MFGGKKRSRAAFEIGVRKPPQERLAEARGVESVESVEGGRKEHRRTGRGAELGPKFTGGPQALLRVDAAAARNRDDFDEACGGQDDLLLELRWVQPVPARHQEGSRVLVDDPGAPRVMINRVKNSKKWTCGS